MQGRRASYHDALWKTWVQVRPCRGTRWQGLSGKARAELVYHSSKTSPAGTVTCSRAVESFLRPLQEPQTIDSFQQSRVRPRCREREPRLEIKPVFIPSGIHQTSLGINEHRQGYEIFRFMLMVTIHVGLIVGPETTGHIS